MARYNLSRYNLSKYNRSQAGSETFDKLRAGAVIQAYIGLGQITNDSLWLTSQMAGLAQIGSGSFEKAALSAVWSGNGTGNYIVRNRQTISASLDAENYLSPKVLDRLSPAAILSAAANLSPNVRDSVQASAEIGGEFYLGNVVIDPEAITVYGIFGAAVTAENLSEVVLTFSCSIPAKGTLVIDSDNFRVLLNGNNAIKYHSGDWIDELCRDTKSIKIESGGTTLTAEIYYQELWL